MNKLGVIGLMSRSPLVLAACGETTGDRAISGAGVGAGTGAAAGAALGGVGAVPGAAIGAGVGAATGGATEEDTIDLGEPPWR